MKTIRNAKGLYQFLNNLNDVEFNLIKHNIDIAIYIRQIQKQFLLSDLEMMRKLKTNNIVFRKMKKGGFSFTLMHLAKLDAIVNEESANSKTVQINLSKKK